MDMSIIKYVASRISLLLLILASMGLGALLSHMPASQVDSQQVQQNTSTQGPTAPPTATPRATQTIPPSTPLPSLTPSQTLLPPPTFEPPTLTPAPSATPSVTPTATLVPIMNIPGLQGLESPTPSSTPGCKPRKDWTLTYEVQPNDALDNIAARYGTNRWELADGNCLADPNLIVVGQVLRVPGQAQPQTTIECVPWQVLTPMNWAVGVDGNGQLTFDWIGPRAPRNLIRVYDASGNEVWEDVVDLRQNYTLDVASSLPAAAGIYTWKVFPLDLNFQQINCLEGGPWTFEKTQTIPTPTPVPTLAR
jgi:LysM repeat protein